MAGARRLLRCAKSRSAPSRSVAGTRGPGKAEGASYGDGAGRAEGLGAHVYDAVDEILESVAQKPREHVAVQRALLRSVQI